MNNLKDPLFWVGVSIVGFLVFSNYVAANVLIGAGGNFAEHYTQILQGRTRYIS